MILNPAAVPVGVALFIYNVQSGTVLDLSGPNHHNSMSNASEIINRFDALTQLPDGLLIREAINKCVEILLLGIPSSDLECYIVDFPVSGRFLHHTKCAL